MRWDDDSGPDVTPELWPDDDWGELDYEPEYDGPQEPLCATCVDRGTVPGRLGGTRPCPWCEQPDWIDRAHRALLTLWWRFGLWRHVRRFRRRQLGADDPPF